MTDNDDRQTEFIKLDLTPAEIQELGRQLARENQAVYDLEKRKKMEMAELTILLKAANADAEKTTSKINLGYEEREVDVLRLMNKPRHGIKTIIRADNHEKVREAEMTAKEIADEMQGNFFMPPIGEAGYGAGE